MGVAAQKLIASDAILAMYVFCIGVFVKLTYLRNLEPPVHKAMFATCVPRSATMKHTFNPAWTGQ